MSQPEHPDLEKLRLEDDDCHEILIDDKVASEAMVQEKGKEKEEKEENEIDNEKGEILITVQFSDIISPTNTYLTMENDSDSLDPLVMVKTKTTVWKCISQMNKGKVRENFIDFVRNQSNIEMDESKLLGYLNDSKSAELRVTIDGCEVAVGIPFELVLLIINFMTYLYIGDASYEAADEQTKRMICTLRANRVEVCRKCDLVRMTREEFRSFLLSFISTEEAVGGIMECYDKNPLVTKNLFESLMFESIAGRMYLSEKKSFAPFITASDEATALSGIVPKTIPSSLSIPTAKDKKGKDEEIGEEKEDVKEEKEEGELMRVESHLLWRLFKKLGAIMEMYGTGQTCEDQLCHTLRQVMLIGHSTESCLSSKGQGLLHLDPENRHDQIISQLSCCILLSLTLEPLVKPEAPEVSMTISLIKSLMIVMSSSARTIGEMPEENLESQETNESNDGEEKD